MNEKYTWSEFEIAKAFIWNLENKGYVDTNVDDFDEFMKEWHKHLLETGYLNKR